MKMKDGQIYWKLSNNNESVREVQSIVMIYCFDGDTPRKTYTLTNLNRESIKIDFNSACVPTCSLASKFYLESG